MSIYPRFIEQLLLESAVSFNNAKSHIEIKEKVITSGYDDAKLDGLLALNARADAKYHEYERLHGEQLQTTNLLNNQFKESLDFYSFYRKLAFKVFPGAANKGIRSQLGIDERHKNSLKGFIAQATQFFDTLLKKEEIREAFAEFALTTEKIQEILNAFEELKRLNELQESKKGAAQTARKERDDLCEELRVGYEKLKTVCRYLFRDTPQTLKTLNIEVLNYRGKKNKNNDNQDDQTDQTGQADQTDQTPPA